MVSLREVQEKKFSASPQEPKIESSGRGAF